VEARPLGKSPTRLEKESSCRLDCTTLLGCASYIGRQHERELHRLHLDAGILSVKPVIISLLQLLERSYFFRVGSSSLRKANERTYAV